MSDTIGSFVTEDKVSEIKMGRFGTVSDSIKDTGKVKIGGSGIHFGDAPASTKDKGRVRVGGSGIQF